MRAGEQHPVGADFPSAQRVEDPSSQFQRPDGPRFPPSRRPWAVLAWIAGLIALFVIFLRISLSSAITSDGSNNALQAWDLLHGHILLHGWLIGDATYYTLELPALAVSELVFGLRDLASHAASALTYAIVAACAVGVAVTTSRGSARLARCGVVIAVLASPLFIPSDVWIALGAPDHMGTSAFLLVSFLLIDRVPGKRYTAPLLCVILCAGQLGDAIVRYIAVPAIVLVCAYRMLAARRIRTADAAIAVAAIVSVPLESAVRAVMRHFGGYLMVAPQVHFAPPGQWAHNATLTLHALRELFGNVPWPTVSSSAGGAAVFGFICMLAALAGLVRVLVTWRTASRAEQLLCVTIVANVAAFEITTMPRLFNPHEMAAVLPCGAVLAARALVPARIARLGRARLAMAAAAAAALLPLAVAATVAPVGSRATSLITWLEAHHLSYGLSSYWDGSTVTEEAGGKVALRTVLIHGRKVTPYNWETNTLWFDPSRNDATFAVVQDGDPGFTVSDVTRAFGKPVSVHRMAYWVVLIYHENLLKPVVPAPLPPIQ